MVNPIRRMIRGIEDFIKRDKDFDVSVETNDEISQLSSAIRSLCSRVSPAEGGR
jgi:methyl-accepting chemotaxis protein